MPWILTVSPRSLAAGGVEVTERATGERSTRPIEEVEALLRGWLMSSGTSFARALRTSAICSSLSVVPSSEMTASPVRPCSSTSSADETIGPVSVSSCESIRPIENVTPGGIDAVMRDLGDPVRRALLAERRVGHLLERRRLDDEVGQDARVDPLDDRRDATAGRAHGRACLLTELLLGRGVLRPLRVATPGRACCGLLGAAAASAASRARLMKLTREV